MLFSIQTGFILGALHVLSGPDHLIAMAPGSMKSPRLALKDGLAWGVGHSSGVLLLSFLAILTKGIINVEKMSSIAELVVGITLLVVGVFAIRSALGLNIHMHRHRHEGVTEHRHIHFHLLGRKLHAHHTHAVTGLGVLHGLAGAGHLLAVIPAYALPKVGALLYLSSYLIGSVFAMGGFVVFFSLATKQIGKRLTPVLLGTTGIISIGTGFFWLQKTSVNFI